jgi:tripartite-type tricarboxylate transporter receptor subunit TctC
MQKELGQPVVIKNVPGGGGHIAARQFQQTPADGYTMIFGSDSGVYIDSLMKPTEGFDLTTWKWVAGVRSQPSAVMVRKESPLKSIDDLIQADKSGQRLRFGHNGIAGGYLPQQAIFAAALGLKNVAYVGGFGGTADILPALVRGDTDVEVVRPVSSVIQFVKNGDIRPLMVYPAEGISLIPETPSARQLNLPNASDFEATGLATIGFMVTGNVSNDRIAVLEQATLNALQDPDFLKWAVESGVEPDLRPAGAAEMTARKKEEYQIWKRYEDVIRAVAE